MQFKKPKRAFKNMLPHIRELNLEFISHFIMDVLLWSKQILCNYKSA